MKTEPHQKTGISNNLTPLERIHHFFDPTQAPLTLQPLILPLLAQRGVTLQLVRDDLLHPMIAGNKWWKLKYALIEAARQQKSTLVTFGGAYSNHLLATAAAGHLFGFRTVGLVRGEEKRALNPLLSQATQWGMECIGISREQYRRKNDPDYLASLRERWDTCMILPEGGSGPFAVQGTREMVSRLDLPYDILCCPVGTGGTMAGMITGAVGQSKVIGFSALKGPGNLESEVRRMIEGSETACHDWELITEFHGGGYARSNHALRQCCETLRQEQGVELDLVYTGKMVYGLLELVRRGVFDEGTRIVAWHTGNTWSPECARQGRSP